jgi:hypothetical protein
MTHDEALALRDQATALRDSLRADIANAMTRNEHIRITQHAAAAERLVSALDILLDPS